MLFLPTRLEEQLPALWPPENCPEVAWDSLQSPQMPGCSGINSAICLLSGLHQFYAVVGEQGSVVCLCLCVIVLCERELNMGLENLYRVPSSPECQLCARIPLESIQTLPALCGCTPVSVVVGMWKWGQQATRENRTQVITDVVVWLSMFQPHVGLEVTRTQ